MLQIAPQIRIFVAVEAVDFRKGIDSLAELCRAKLQTDPFDYITELQRHARELARNPSAWMPWNYRETLARLATTTAP